MIQFVNHNNKVRSHTSDTPTATILTTDSSFISVMVEL